MSIIFNKNVFFLTTNNSSYQIQIGKYGHLVHTYYGKRVDYFNMDYTLKYEYKTFTPCVTEAGMDKTYSLDVLPNEYPYEGSGDFRHSALALRDHNGSCALDLKYLSHEITEGKYSLKGLPVVNSYDKAQTLSIVLKDERLDVYVELLYSLIEELDLITRSVRITNKSDNTYVLQNIQSMALDFLYGDFNITSFQGSHGNERLKEVQEVKHGELSFVSRKGSSSHQMNPFFILSDKETTEDFGSCYGFSLLYSGSFKACASQDQFGSTRFTLGLMDERLDYKLKTNETFETPEATLIYSDSGFSKLSHNYHDVVRYHIVRGPYKTKIRPVVINNWEATYFDFNREKLLKIAKEAKDMNLDMFVLDDGWFGERKDDERALGDWDVNEEKLGGTLASLAAEINEIGLGFGLWIEPEMINEDSLLFKEHPEWVLSVKGKGPCRTRCQLVLDFSNKEVEDYIFNKISNVVASANVEYIKMDMNRYLTDVASSVLDYQSQGEVLHKYVLGVYSFLERMLTKFPNILIEGCSGGGGRFDLGMLYYTPQIWTSDNTDAIDRIKIQYGTSFCYPISSVDANISAVPNHQTGRTTPFNTRYVVSLAGNFGYQLDLEKLTDDEKEQVRSQVKEYKELWSLIHNGRYFRLTDPINNNDDEAWQMVSRDQKEALLSVVTVRAHYNYKHKNIKMKGLNPQALYLNKETGETYSGGALMYNGIRIPDSLDDYQAFLMHFVQID